MWSLVVPRALGHGLEQSPLPPALSLVCQSPTIALGYVSVKIQLRSLSVSDIGPRLRKSKDTVKKELWLWCCGHLAHARLDMVLSSCLDFASPRLACPTLALGYISLKIQLRRIWLWSLVGPRT